MSDSHRRKILATCEICEVVRCADGGAIHLHFVTASIRAKPCYRRLDELLPKWWK
jgi:hypothetical protein